MIENQIKKEKIWKSKKYVGLDKSLSSLLRRADARSRKRWHQFGLPYV